MDAADHRALTWLVEEYARAADARDPEAVARLFIPDGALVTSLRSGRTDPPEVFTGGAEIARAIGRLRSLVSCRHVVLSAEFRGTPSGTRGSTMAAVQHVFRSASGDRVEDLVVRYDDAFELESGIWKFARRELSALERRESIAVPPPNPGSSS